MSSYKELGFTGLLYKATSSSEPTELSEDISSQLIPLLTGGAVAGGTTTSNSKRISINWDTGTIIISDGANDRVIIGEDGL